ncbi:MAG: 3'-5' exonuclease [Atopobiaceae bacterium]|nr:3'-5' exonuclease [Atopobiaceae bacterium]
MVLAEAIELANAFSLPGFFSDDVTLTEERRRNEEAISLLMAAWFEAPTGQEPFSFDLVRSLADRNRTICDTFGAERLRDANGSNLQRKLPDADLVHAVAKLQRRRDTQVARTAGAGVRDLGVAMADAPFKGAVMGFDIETTDRNPDRGYIINLGLAFMELTPNAVPREGHAAYFGIPEMYREKGVPLSDIHQITWSELDGKTPFREDKKVQKALLKAFCKLPYMAHNAAFEDSWLMLHLDGYAEARKAKKVTIIDSRDICRRIDVDGRSLPRESFPNTLENWARRRGTLRPDEKERHLGLDDVFLMLRTVQAELVLRNML